MEATKDEIIFRNELNLTRDSAGDLSLQYWLICEWNYRGKRYSQLVETSEIGELGDLKKKKLNRIILFNSIVIHK